MSRTQYEVNEQGENDNATASSANMSSIAGGFGASETTLLTTAQTYFADEKIPVPETTTVSF